MPLLSSSPQPVLVLSAVGFTPPEIHRIESQLQLAPIGGVTWRLGAFERADAWLACGQRTHLIADDEVTVAAASPTQAPVRFWLPQVDRPIAFSLPIACENFEPACTFTLESQSSFVIALAKLSQWLRPRVMLLQICDLLARHAARLKKSRIYHLLANNRLVAVVDLKGDIGVLPEASLGDLARAIWMPRPDAAGYVPESFVHAATRELLWEYASRTDRDILPARFRTAPLLLRRAPLLAQRLLSDAQLFVVRELTQSERTLEQLCASAKFCANDISRALAALYLVGSVTTSPGRAALGRKSQPPASSWPWELSSQSDMSRGMQDLTAPAFLSAF